MDGTLIYSYMGVCVLSIKEEEQADLGIIISPNPSDDKIHIQLSEKFQANQVRIYSIKGIKVIDVEYNSTLDVGHLQSGIYLLEVIDNDGFRDIQRFVKK